MAMVPVSLTFLSVPPSSSAWACPARQVASTRPIIRRHFIVLSWLSRHSPETMQWLGHRMDRILTSALSSHIALYESGSGESDGLANSCVYSGEIGALRFNPLGGIFCTN